jgi:hypothetical protein
MGENGKDYDSFVALRITRKFSLLASEVDWKIVCVARLVYVLNQGFLHR